MGNFVFGDFGASASDKNNELWTALAEKAYAQLNESGGIGQDGTNSYQGIVSGSVGTAIKQITGRDADLSTTGGTSDARFIRNHCPVIEFGIVGATMHKTDERVAVSDMTALTAIYSEILKSWFGA